MQSAITADEFKLGVMMEISGIRNSADLRPFPNQLRW
jgi:hypothetical protein